MTRFLFHYRTTLHATTRASPAGMILRKQHRTRLNFGQGPPWLPGVIQESKGLVSYTVELEDGHVFRRHMDHLSVNMYNKLNDVYGKVHV